MKHLPALFIVGLSLLLAPRASAAAGVTASIQPSAIAVGQSADLTLTFEEVTPIEVPPPVPVVPGLSFRYTGQGQEIRIQNSQVISRVLHHYRVTAAQQGEYIIPAMRIPVKNDTTAQTNIAQTTPIRLRVGAGQENHFASLTLQVPKTNLYVGEAIPLEIQLYFQYIREARMPLVQADGFTVGSVVTLQQSAALRDNARYNLLPFRVSATPVKTGRLTLGPATIQARVPHRNSRVNLFNQPVDWIETTLKSELHEVQVHPLPDEGRPPEFNGAIGSYTMNVLASPTNLIAGDPITLRVIISGSGNLDQIPFPPQKEAWREFKLYPPTGSTEATDQLGLTGRRQFEQVIIPQNAEITAVPELRFSYFDPELKKYHTLTSRPIPITVRPNPTGQPHPTVVAASRSQEGTQAPRDILHIKPHLGTVESFHPPWITRPWFLALQAIPLLAWISAKAYRIREQKLAGNPRLRRKLEVHRAVRTGLADLERLAMGTDAERFFAAAFRLLQEQIGERLDMPASAITESAIDDELRPRGISEDLARQLHELFQASNQARFAPERPSEELATWVPRVASALAALQQAHLTPRRSQ